MAPVPPVPVWDRLWNFSRDLIFPDLSLSFNEYGVAPYNPKAAWHRSWFEALAAHYKFSLDTPLKDLDPGPAGYNAERF